MDPLDFAGYSLVKRLGRGGVASVYKAIAPTGETVALKVLHTEIEVTEEVRQRFEQEFEISRKVDHPNIVRYLDFGIAEGRPYLVMEYIEGKSLWDRIQKLGPMAEWSVIRMAQDIGAALDASHRLGIIHRDVKPNNIFMTQEGHAKLMDFGLVKDLADTQSMTPNHVIMGTPFFMAPEQFFDPTHLDHSVDVYGLAASVYFALSGKLPFRFRGRGLLEKKLAGQFVAPGDSAPGISADVMPVLASALDAEPARRPNACADLVKMLCNSATERPEPAARNRQPVGRERRSIMRSDCHFEGVCVAADGGQEVSARISDVSTEGVCLFLGRAFPENAILSLSFRFMGEEDHWDYQMRVVNVRPWTGGEWRHGFRFVEPMERAELSNLLKESSKNVRIHVSPSGEDWAGVVMADTGSGTPLEGQGRPTLSRNQALAASPGMVSAGRILSDAVSADFTAEVKVPGLFEPDEEPLRPGATPLHGAGLLLFGGQDNYVRFERVARIENGRQLNHVSWTFATHGKVKRFRSKPISNQDTWLRVDRRGGILRTFLSQDGARWTSFKHAFSMCPSADVKIGLIAANVTSRPFLVEFEDFEVRMK